MLMPGMGRRNIFGAPMRQDIPGMTPPFVPPEPAEAEFKKPSMGALIAGVVGDTLSQIGGGQGMFLPALYRQQEMAAKAQMDAAQRGADFANWEQKERWKLANPAPAQPTEFERSVIAAGYQPGTPEYINLMRQRAQNQADPIRAVPGVDATGNDVLRFIRPSQFGASASASPPAGVTFTPLPPAGGATPSGSRTFR